MDAADATYRLMCDKGLKELKELLAQPGRLKLLLKVGYLRQESASLQPGSQEAAESAVEDEDVQAFAARIWRKLNPEERQKLLALVKEAGGPDALEEFEHEMESRRPMLVKFVS